MTSFQSINSVEYDEDLTPKKGIPLYRRGPFSQSKIEFIETHDQLSQRGLYKSQICQTPTQYPSKTKNNLQSVKDKQQKYKHTIDYYHMI